MNGLICRWVSLFAARLHVHAGSILSELLCPHMAAVEQSLVSSYIR